MKKLISLIITLTILGAGRLWADEPTKSLRDKSTVEVWQHHIDSWAKRDLSEIASDYDQESILILNGKIYQGPTQIREIFRSLFRIFDNGENKIDPVIIMDRIVYITWNFTPTGLKTQFGSDTFLIEQGKIKVQTIASPLYDLFP